ncbi:hypothetical protein D9T14_00520 [Propionibacterium australiense]|nr:hypothetical protein D7U36_07740 [Propionibacterium australiense]RLP12375.1 hypothetical protein D9T14_00520 [Propionibacterium australiense]
MPRRYARHDQPGAPANSEVAITHPAVYDKSVICDVDRLFVERVSDSTRQRITDDAQKAVMARHLA